tara:strand:+ start:327 stop:851 length:525 start_codon:yes stop_codon:yes gene_type:complete
MKKFFSFSGTISGKTFFLRTLFIIIMCIPLLIVTIAKWTSYFMSLSEFDIYDSSIENQMEIQKFGDELALKIAENPEFYLNDFMNSFSAIWILFFIVCIVPIIWFGLTTSYKRISALFYEHRNSVFFSFVLFDIVSRYIAFNSSGILNTIVTFLGLLIFAFLVFYSSSFEKHDG